MQSSAVFSLSPSLPLLKPRRLSLRHHSLTTASSDLNISPNVVSIPSLSRRSWRLASSDSPLRAWSGVPSSISHSLDTNRFKTAATAVPESAEEGDNSGKLTKILELGLLFAMWYLFNIYFNIYNKQVQAFPSFAYCICPQCFRFLYMLSLVHCFLCFESMENSEI